VPALYLDSSAIVKLVAAEAESLALFDFIRQYAERLSSVLARLEVRRAVRRAGGSAERRRADRVLARMVMLQTLTVGLIGYGCGVGLASLFGMIVLKKGMPPYFLPWQLPMITLLAILFICWLAASLGIKKIRSLEPAVVFRG